MTISADAVVERPQLEARDRQRASSRRSPRGYLTRALLIFTIAACLVWLVIHAVVAWTAYRAAQADLSRLRTDVPTHLTGLSAAQVQQLANQSHALNVDLTRLDAATTLPLGGAVVHLPWLGPHYRALHQFLQIGRLTTAAATTGGQSAVGALESLRVSGVSTAKTSAQQPTWLDMLLTGQTSLVRAADELSQAQSLRAQLDPKQLPGPARARLATVDGYLGRLDPATLGSVDLPALRSGLGYDHDVRYALIFQDPQELRPAGGFAGTLALVTVSHGQIKDVTFSLSNPLSDAYNARRSTELAQPWPIQTFFPQQGFQIQDALWWADFPTGAQTYMRMYAVAGWPPIDGVIAVQPAVVSDLLRIYGPLSVDVDGQTRSITADNLVSEIERQEELRRQTHVDVTTHKELLMAVGEELVSRMTATGGPDATRTLTALMTAADRRDIQLYAADPTVEKALEARAWTGRLEPRPGTPTISVTLANVAINKSSLALATTAKLELGAVDNGRQQATLTLDLTHTGNNSGDPLFTGFQKWYVEVALPEGAQLGSAQPERLANPQAPNGGSYEIDLYAGQSGRITIQFSMPAGQQVLFRRQPGLNPVELTTAVCGQTQSQPVRADLLLTTTCQP